MSLLALDLGTRTGWALDEHGRIETGVTVFDVKRGESPGMRYLRFNRWLSELVLGSGSPRARLIVYEQTHQRGGAATEVAAGFATRVQEFAARHGIDHAAVHSATLKKWATGRGNAKKPEMIAAARARFGYEGTDDDEADALALLHYAMAELAPTGGVTVVRVRLAGGQTIETEPPPERAA